MGKLSAFVYTKKQSEPENLPKSLRNLHDLWQDEGWSLELRAVALLLADLLDQGWEVTTGPRQMLLQPPGLRLPDESVEQAKLRIRKSLNVGRDRQLNEPSVRKFLDEMHRPARRRGLGPSSIEDLIDDGAQLAEQLGSISVAFSDKDEALKQVIDPVIEACDDEATCEFTGFRLIDIWRYFRHTWSLEYRSIPGRQLALLVRNAARPKRPVIGIAMLASPVLRSRARDDSIGWTLNAFINRLIAGQWDQDAAIRGLWSRIVKSIADIRSDDLVNPNEIENPTERTVLRLQQRAAGAAIARVNRLQEFYSESEATNQQIRSQRGPKTANTEHAVWQEASEDMLFVRKRAQTLAKLLDAKRVFLLKGWDRGVQEPIEQAVKDPRVEGALETALQEVRKAGLSSLVADLSVCGAVAPYNVLLGGKLVALLMASDEVRNIYRTRYAEQVSIIGSQMAGRAISKPAELKLITTTSLYGNGSSQYNRLRISSKDYPALIHDIAWKEQATTAGYGSVHLGSTTVRVLREISQKTHRARRVNHRFGEGSSPRLRQIREAVEALGIRSDAVLNHATPRILYTCELHPGAIDELLGINPLQEVRGPSVAAIAVAWRSRWLSRRVERSETLALLSTLGASAIKSNLLISCPSTESTADAVSENRDPVVEQSPERQTHQTETMQE